MRGRSSRWTAAVAAIVAGALMLAAATPALGAQASVIVDSREIQLTEADRGWTTEVGITNLLDREIDLEIPFLGEGCLPRIQDGKLRVAEHRTVEIKIPPKCDAGEKGLVFYLATATPAGPPFPIEMVAAPLEEEEEPSWAALWTFLGAFLVLAAAATVYLRLWRKEKRKTALEHLGATWSFKESWVSSVTVAGGLLTGIFGSSEVVKAVLGEEVDSAVALATVGAAISLALLAAAPLILEATKVLVVDPKKPNELGAEHPSLAGLSLAYAVTLAAAFGELWVVAASASRLDLGGSEDWMPWLLAGLGTLLLAVYGVRNFKRTIKVGTTEPAPAPDSDTIKGARLIVQQMKKSDRVQVSSATLDEAFDHFASTAPIGGSAKSAPPPPRPAAMP
ncbi:MAG TPA: hypothetical protein VFY48_03315 [Solirubrobacterales bacterium]|nr:hypothetical protein [Solirubrobacterales bacterium]